MLTARLRLFVEACISRIVDFVFNLKKTTPSSMGVRASSDLRV